VQVFEQSQRNICSSTEAHNVGLYKLGTTTLITSSFRYTPAGIKASARFRFATMWLGRDGVTAHSARVSKKTLAHVRLPARRSD